VESESWTNIIDQHQLSRILYQKMTFGLLTGDRLKKGGDTQTTQSKSHQDPKISRKSSFERRLSKKKKKASNGQKHAFKTLPASSKRDRTIKKH